MYVKQLSVFIENTPGRLAQFTRMLGENHVDLASICIADTTNFGILRAIVDQPDEVCALIAANGYTVTMTDVLTAAVPDEPGALAKVLQILADQEISVEYVYSALRNAGDAAAIVFRVDDLPKAEAALQAASVRLLSQQMLTASNHVFD